MKIFKTKQEKAVEYKQNMLGEEAKIDLQGGPSFRNFVHGVEALNFIFVLVKSKVMNSGLKYSRDLSFRIYIHSNKKGSLIVKTYHQVSFDLT